MVVLDACGVGALAGCRRLRRRRHQHARPSGARPAGGCSAGARAARARHDPRARRACHRPRDPVAARPPARARPRQGLDRRPLGADGRRRPRRALPTYPDGFPEEVIAVVTAASGRGVLCNRPYNGIEAIEDFGAEHCGAGELIVYTSQDSVLQIAAHVDVVRPRSCTRSAARVRAALRGRARRRARDRASVRGRGTGAYERTDGRRDYALAPPARSYLQELQDAGVAVHTVGKVGQLFAGVGDRRPASRGDQRAGARRDDRADRARWSRVRVHEPDRDRPGLRPPPRCRGLQPARSARSTRAWPRGSALLRDDDLLVLTADHGCDVTSPRTDHTREHAPLLAAFDGTAGAATTGRSPTSARAC